MQRPVFQELMKRFQQKRPLIQVLLGPRQVGKTTLALQLAEKLERASHYASCDLATLQDVNWIRQQWEIGRLKVKESGAALLILDEVQKISHWSDFIKALWDEDTRNKLSLAVVLLGSSPWLMQKGLTESLAGRFEIIPITHWSFFEMHQAFGWTLEEFIYFGGYPGTASLMKEQNNEARFMQYINDSLIETTVSRDILLMTQVNKPILLRRLLQLGCLYSGQILSFSKMLGELHDAGNTTTLSHYLELLAGAGLLTGLQKFSKQQFRQKASSPKLCVLNTALMTAQTGKSFHEAKKETAYWGRLVESSVGSTLLNAIRGTQMELFYWREGDQEVDFVLRQGSTICAIEVKTGKNKKSGMDLFVKQFNPQKILMVGSAGLPLEDFFSMTALQILKTWS